MARLSPVASAVSARSSAAPSSHPAEQAHRRAALGVPGTIIALVAAAGIVACASPTAPSTARACPPGVSVGSGQC